MLCDKQGLLSAVDFQILYFTNESAEEVCKIISDYKNGSLYFECLSLLPQDVQTVFLKNTVREELEERLNIYFQGVFANLH